MVKPIKASTLIRSAVFFIALLNQGLALAGKSPLPFDEAKTELFVSYGISAVTAVAAWWKNNDFTKKARTK